MCLLFQKGALCRIGIIVYSEDFNLSLLDSLENQVGVQMNVFRV